MTTLQAVRLPRATRRPSATSIAIVVALHIAIIYGLYLGLINTWIIPTSHGPITVVRVPDTTKPTTPNNPPIASVPFAQPTNPNVPRPDIVIEQDRDTGGITNTAGNPQGQAAPVVVAARGILSTHTIPNYPALAIRLNQTGNVLLHLSIDERGVVTAATVERSSGYDTLDNAAVAWVIAHWRYEPATRDGKPFATTSDALVTFRLTSG